MSDQDPDDLRSLFDDAVADVVPTDRLGEIRRRTTQPPTRSRRWGLVLAAGTATAAVVGVGAVIGQLGLPGDDGDRVAAGKQTAVAAYFVGTTPEGERLFREFQSVPVSDDPAAVALEALRLLETDTGPMDPDYGTDWPDGSFLGVSLEDGTIRIDLADQWPVLPPAPAPQQAIFTVQAALGQTLPVQMVNPEGVLDINDDGEPAANRDNDLLAPVNITDPAEGHTVDDLLTIRGTARPGRDNFDSVRWSVRSTDGTVVLADSTLIRNSAWEQTISIADLAPGTYVLTVRAASTNGRATDTRTITVR